MSIFGNSKRNWTAETVLLALCVLAAPVWFAFPVAAYGVLNWYVTGFDDLVIFSATYLDAKKQKRELAAIAGLLAAVACMIVLVALMGQGLQYFKQYAKWSALVPAAYAVRSAWKWYRGESQEEDARWMHYKMFGRAFFGYFANSIDDIALNTSMVGGAYADHAVQYLGGVFLGAVTMVVLAKVVGRWAGSHPVFQIVGYLVAISIILSSSGSD